MPPVRSRPSNRFASYSGAFVASYLHRTSPDLPPQVGVLVELDKEKEQVGNKKPK